MSGSPTLLRDFRAVYEEIERRTSQELTAMCWNLRKAHAYLRSNAQYLVNYGARYRKGLPISSAIAEPAVNQVVWKTICPVFLKHEIQRHGNPVFGERYRIFSRRSRSDGEVAASGLGEVSRPRFAE